MKKLNILFILLFCLCGFAFAQSSDSSSSARTSDVESSSSSAGLVSASTSTAASSTSSDTLANREKEFIITDTTETVSPPQSNTISGIFSFIKMIFVLAIVVVCIFLVMNFFKKTSGQDTKNNDLFLRKVASINLGPGKSVNVVTLFDKGYVLGVTDNNVNLLGTLDNKDEINMLNVEHDKNSKAKTNKSFMEILEMFLPSKSLSTTEATKENIYSDSTKTVNDFVKNQRTRIKNKKSEK